MKSLAHLGQQLKALPHDQRRLVLSSLSPTALDEILKCWPIWARESQLPPQGDAWAYWLILAGRGFGKSKTGASWIIDEARKFPMRIALVGSDPKDVRETMILGESGIIASSPSSFMPTYNPSLGKLTWPNGSIAQVFSSEDPESLRGPQFHAAWCDEICAWGYPQETWDMLLMCLRLPRPDGMPPRACITTTPKPMQLLRDIMRDPFTVITRGRTMDNAANLSSTTLAALKRRYEGTRLGRQELEAEVLDDIEGALWSTRLIEDNRVKKSDLPRMRRIVIGVDPAVTASAGSDETGIVVVGHGDDDVFYILDDQSGTLSPNEWARRVAGLYDDHKADRIIAERNNGGDLVAQNLRLVSRNLPITSVNASRGKVARAEPICALYEQGRVKHVGYLDKLEKQMLAFTGKAGNHDDRVDALVWALTEASEYTEFVWSMS